MPIEIISLLVVSFLSLLIFLYLRVSRKAVWALLAKTSTSVFFILFALLSMWQNPNSFSFALFIVAGLLFSLLGDIFLDLKVVYTKDQDMYLYVGMVVFSLAHVFYSFALYIFFGAPFLWALILLAIFFSAAVVFSEKLLKLKMGKFKLPAFLYGSMLTLTLLISLYHAIFHFSIFFLLMSSGAFLFLISDLILSQMYFSVPAEKGNTSLNIVLNHLTYYFAQFLIASTILFF